MPSFDNVFYEIAALLLVAAAAGALALRLRQPLIVAFIAVGILVGPSGLGWVAASDQVELLAALGIALLLFIVGLNLDVHLIRTMGPVALATGLGQVAFTSVVGYVLALALGMGHLEAIYVAVALTFSSTIIIVKLLSDKREIDSLHGRIAVGFLIVQDLVVILAMIVLSASGVAGGEATGHLWLQVLAVVVKGVVLLAGVALLMRYVLPRLLRTLARSTELLVLFSIAWAVTLGAVGSYLGMSKEVGAFLAGVSIASTPYREAITSRLVSLRDFLLLFFFIELGAMVDIGLLGAKVFDSLILSAFVLIGNPLIVMVIMGIMGYRKRTGFLAGLTVAQISEFSLIFGALGVSLGHINAETLGLITFVGLITIGLSTYMILYSHVLYEWLSPALSPFERRMPHREAAIDGTDTAHPVDAIVFGVGRFGAGVVRGLTEQGWRVLAVDFDPQLVDAWHREGRWAVYGDAEDPDFPASLPLARAGWVICTIPQVSVAQSLVSALRTHGYQGQIAATAHHQADARRLESAGVDLILRPFPAAAEHTVALLTQTGRTAFTEARNESPA